MNPLAAAWVGCALTCLAAYGLGSAVLRLGGVWRPTLQIGVASVLGGFPILSVLLFALAATQLLTLPILLTFSAVCIALGFVKGKSLSAPAEPGKPTGSRSRIGTIARWLMGAGMAAFAVRYLLHAMIPDDAYDSSYYHLGYIRRYLEHGGFVYYTDNIYAAFSQGCELIYLLAYSVGPESGPSLVHVFFLFLTTAVVYYLLLPETGQTAALGAALLVLATPVLGRVSTYAYVEGAMLSAVIGTLWMLERWRRDNRNVWLALAGLLTGFAYAVKYTAAVIAILAVLYVLWHRRKHPRQLLRDLAVFCLCAAVVALPWVMRNWIVYENPFAPLFNQYFPNPYFLVSVEDDWRANQRIYGWLRSYWDLPKEWLFGGWHLQGLIGLGFIAAPIALFAVTSRLGRWALLGMATFLAIYPANIGTRFLTPALCFTAVAMAIALKRYPAVIVAIALFQGLASWPRFLEDYTHISAWRLGALQDWKNISTVEKRREYLERYSATYNLGKLIDETAVTEGKVFSMNIVAEGYTRRRTCPQFASASCHEAFHLLRSAFMRDFRQTISVHDSFAPRQITAVRLLLTAQNSRQEWNFSEMHFSLDGVPLERSDAWKLRGSHMPWLLPLAFDNSPATAWFSGQPREDGMFVEVEFDSPKTIDRVETRMAPAFPIPEYQVELREENGSWNPVTTTRASEYVNAPGFAREAILALYRGGFRYLALYKEDLFFDDMLKEQERFGLRLVGRNGAGAVFEIIP